MRLFFYGTLKRGGRWNTIIKDANSKYLEDKTIDGFKLGMMNGTKPEYNFPVLIMQDGCKVKGEVWKISNYDLITVKYLEKGYSFVEIEPNLFTFLGGCLEDCSHSTDPLLSINNNIYEFRV